MLFLVLMLAIIPSETPDVKQEVTSELAKELVTAYTIVYDTAKTDELLQRSIEHTPNQGKTILGIT